VSARLLRTSPIEPWQRARGARLVARDGGMLAADLGDPQGERAACADLALADLSALWRWGLKGTGTIEWARAQGTVVPDAPNRAAPQPGGGLVLRLAARELFWLGCGQGLDDAWERGEGARGWPLLRAHGHAWLALTGERAPALLARVCALDLRPHRFQPLAVAQTRALGLSVILVRAPTAGLRYDLLVDSASAPWAWRALLVELEDLGGRPVGADALG
jgi:sarcosine oxidase subunit gamma